MQSCLFNFRRVACTTRICCHENANIRAQKGTGSFRRQGRMCQELLFRVPRAPERMQLQDMDLSLRSMCTNATCLQGYAVRYSVSFLQNDKRHTAKQCTVFRMIIDRPPTSVSSSRMISDRTLTSVPSSE